MADSNQSSRVRAWRERIVIPTYTAGAPDPNPCFLEKRVYQGSSGAVYPYPVVETVSDRKAPREYDAVFLENEYLSIMILPELGGRVQMALDKTNDYHFVYYNRVIKPALVGLAGPWISGGIEFNWPQHHRPSTFHPVDVDLVAGDDGSWVVWCHEIDRMCGTRGSHGFVLHPDKAYLEVRVRLFNRTPLPQTFLWWANPAVHVDENHQSIFPPDVVAVMDHGKRDVSSFPIATGTYYKVDYSPGTDISRYKNIPVPTSYMAYHSEYNFVGSYDHGRQAGLLHVADRHVSPGKKQWTWGCGEFGKAWDRQLTDEDGPYIELMCGVYTDNQPDFSWLSPGEEKSFSQYFMPYKGVGVIKNATIDAVLGLEVIGSQATARVYATSRLDQARIVLRDRATTLLDERFDATPHACVSFTADVAQRDVEMVPQLFAAVYDALGRLLVSFSPEPVDRTLPEPAKAVEDPNSLDSIEDLYLAGQHLEQYRHATRDPERYYREALRRDRDDLRCNVALGRVLMRRGLFEEAESHFRRATARATRHNPNPASGESFYYWGLALAALGRWEDAEDSLHKATWNSDCKPSAFFELARLAVRRGVCHAAEGLLRQCLDVNGHHHQATHLLITALVEQGDWQGARLLAERELTRDSFNAGALFELAHSLGGNWQVFDRRMRDDSQNYIELANDYAAAGLFARAASALEHLLLRVGDGLQSPMALYHLASHYSNSGDEASAGECLSQAQAMPRRGFFPHSLQDLAVLQWAAQRDESDYRGWCDLGNLLFSKRRYNEAIRCWEQSRDLAHDFAQPRRNLGLAYFNKQNDAAAAWKSLEQAFRIDPDVARVLYELDQLAKRLNHPPQERLTRLQAFQEVVAQRDDLSIEYVTLLNQLGRHEEALELLLARQFHPWEGGEGKASAQYVVSLTEMARAALAVNDHDAAIELLERAQSRPHSLGEGKLIGALENNLYYWLGRAYQIAGRDDRASERFKRASEGAAELSSPMYYNDQPPDMILYQGLAHRALGNEYEAVQRFTRLVDHGRTHLGDVPSIDFFAVSLPDFLVFEADLALKNEVHCRYMLALGYLGLGNDALAAKQFEHILRLDVNHLGAIVHQGLLQTAEPRAV